MKSLKASLLVGLFCASHAYASGFSLPEYQRFTAHMSPSEIQRQCVKCTTSHASGLYIGSIPSTEEAPPVNFPCLIQSIRGGVPFTPSARHHAVASLSLS